MCMCDSLGYVQTIKGKGLPVFEQEGKFGDLFVEYTVVLPQSISNGLRSSKSSSSSRPLYIPSLGWKDNSWIMELTTDPLLFTQNSRTRSNLIGQARTSYDITQRHFVLNLQ